MSKKVSVVVITYNAKDDLKECLSSLEDQNFGNKEIIVVNDASTDGTLEFLEEYKKNTTIEMMIITNEINLGVAASRNVGIQHATGDIIAFTDADCEADRKWISELVKAFDSRDVVAVGGKVFDKHPSNIWELTDKGHDYVGSKEGFVSYIVGCNMSFAGQILKRYLFNDEIKYGYEEALLCDSIIADGYKIYYNPEATVYHKRRSNLSSLCRRKYLLGLSSVWYRKKQNKLFMFKRHIIIFIALCCFPLIFVHKLFLFLSAFLFLALAASLLKDEIDYKNNNIREIVQTFPFLFFIEFAHFAGSVAGLLKFRVFKPPLLE